MKKILIIITLPLLFIRCEDALQEEPKSFLSRVNFYQSASDAESAVTAAYASLSGFFFYTTWYMALVELSADYANGRGSQSVISEYQGLDPQNQDRAFGAYNEIYAGINRANAVINNVEGIDMDETLKNQLIAEAYFLRAFYYTHLAKDWGPVPLRTEETLDLSNLSAPRAPVADVYALIISDLEKAIPDLPESYPTDQSGRATSWAAKMLLADVHLTNGNWTDARDLAEDVITNGPFSLVEVNEPDDFLQMYGPEVITHSEDIFSIHHTATNGHSVPTFLHRGGQFSVYSAGGFTAWLPNMNSFIGNWNGDDLRKEFNLYTEVVIGGDTIPLPDTSPILFRKYRDPQAPDNQSNSNNIPVYRLAEAYLIYAEAANEAEGAPSALALERLNMVKRRAYGYNPSAPSPVDYPSGLSQAYFRDTVLLERGYEFILELKRWHDLKRTGRAKTAIEATGKTFNDISLLFPLPLDEINNNPALSPADQNPGY